jgi:ABC-type transport system substrate-binding protein
VRGPDGFRGRPGLPLLVPVSYDPDLPGAEEVAEAIAEVLEPLGFGVVVQPADESTWRDGARTGSTGIGVFAVSLGTADRVASLYRCEAGDLNPLGWCEGPNQQLARELLAAADQDRRVEVARELGDLAAEARSWLPLRQRTVRLLVDPDRVDVPGEVRLGSGPLGGLHRFGRVDG